MLGDSGKSDDSVIRQVLAGRQERFGLLVTHYQPVIYGVALAHTGNHADAEDVVQEAFLKAFQSLGKLRDLNRFGPWLISITKNICRDLRSKHLRDFSLVEKVEQRVDVSTHDLGKKELHDILWAQVLKLEESVREILILHYFSGKSTREIAGVLEISTEASEKRLQRARDVLGRELLKVLGSELRHHPDKGTTKKIMAAIAVIGPSQRPIPPLAMEGTGILARIRAHVFPWWHPLLTGAVVLVVLGAGSLWLTKSLQGQNEIHKNSIEELPSVRIASPARRTALQEVLGTALLDNAQSFEFDVEKTGKPENPKGMATITPVDAERVINFPENRSLGMLKIRDAGIKENWIEKGGPWPSTFSAGWEKFREARGEVHVPGGKSVALHVSMDGSRDMSPLSDLGPNDLDLISFNNGSLPITSQVEDKDLVYLENLTGLKALQFWDTSINGSGLDYLKDLQQLEELDLGGCEITDTDLAHIPNLRSLRWLSLHANKVSDEGMVHLTHLTSLRHLLLNGSDITNEGLEALIRLDALEELQISGTKVTDEGIAKLSAFPNLSDLRIGGENISNSALGHLPILSSLRSLRIQESHLINDQGFIALAKVEQLRSLYISSEETTDRGLFYLKYHPSLQRIEMNNIGDEAIEHLSTIPSLEVIYSYLPRITEQSIPSFRRMNSLREIMLTGSNVGDELLSALKNALPRCKVWDRNRGSEFPVTGWRNAFESVYRLEDDEVLRLISTPFIPEREEYWKEIRGQAGLPYSAVFKWDKTLQQWSQRFGQGSSSLFDLLKIIGFAKGDFEGDTRILDTDIDGDWIFWEFASKTQILNSLEAILLEQSELQISFDRKEFVRPTIVVSGQYSFNPLPGVTEDNEIHFFVDTYDARPLGQSGSVGAKVDRLVTYFSELIEVQVVNETQNDEIGHLTLKIHAVDDLTDPDLDIETWTELLIQLLQNLADQTSLEFTIVDQPVEVWVVTGEK